MQVTSVNSFNQQYNYAPAFGVNLQSKKLRFKNDDFFVKIKGYGTNSDWAKKIIETADSAVTYIRKNCNFEETLKRITEGVTEANQFPLDVDKRTHTGILRIKKGGWRYGSNWGPDIITGYGKSKYKSYADRLNYAIKNPIKNPYRDIVLTRPVSEPDFGRYLSHGDARYINNAFRHIEYIYNFLHENFIKNEVKQENMNRVNFSIAEIRWILAHATPWERGSDAISNTFIRSIYKAMGIKVYPLKRGVSLDLEAYCTNLDDYQKQFASYFQHKPNIVD